jgi:hypothetical protein
VINPVDMVKAVRLICAVPDGFPVSEKDSLTREIGTKNPNFLDGLKGLGFIHTSEDGKVWVLSKKSMLESGRQLYSGDLLAQDDLSHEEALRVVGHNFILKAREALEVCDALVFPGVAKESLKNLFLDHLVFNIKLNPFKFDNLLEMLKNLGIISEGEYGYVNFYSPAPLTFYCMTKRYLLEADYEVGKKVHAGDLLEYVERVIPRRSENYDSVGLSKFPFEGWGKYRTWITPELFKELLQVGLVHPLSVVRVLRNLIKEGSEYTPRLKNELLYLKKDRLDRIRKFKGEIVDIDDVLKAYDI